MPQPRYYPSQIPALVAQTNPLPCTEARKIGPVIECAHRSLPSQPVASHAGVQVAPGRTRLPVSAPLADKSCIMPPAGLTRRRNRPAPQPVRFRDGQED
jgi:hypothetical protein